MGQARKGWIDNMDAEEWHLTKWLLKMWEFRSLEFIV